MSLMEVGLCEQLQCGLQGAFVAIMVVTGVVGVGLLALILLHIRRRGLMFIPTI